MIDDFFCVLSNLFFFFSWMDPHDFHNVLSFVQRGYELMRMMDVMDEFNDHACFFLL